MTPADVRVKRKASKLPLFLVAAWAILLVAFMVVRPRPREATFWFLIGAAGAFGVGYMIVETLDSRRTQRQVASWYHRLTALVDVPDYVDDGHLHEWLEPDEQERVIQELEHMPPGSRSLKRALARVSPELIDKDA